MFFLDYSGQEKPLINMELITRLVLQETYLKVTDIFSLSLVCKGVQKECESFKDFYRWHFSMQKTRKYILALNKYECVRNDKRCFTPRTHKEDEKSVKFFRKSDKGCGPHCDGRSRPHMHHIFTELGIITFWYAQCGDDIVTVYN